MSDLNRKTSPLEKAAREAYNPSNREIMDELHRQNQDLADVRFIGQETLQQTKLTNGRVTSLEVATAPVVRDYNRLRVLVGASVILCPVIFKVMEVAIDHIWPVK